ncbi:hypothetical protein IGI04_014930 [Brassica rapa subsp. trilocularis]|uniref:Uncharacterized protein n=1 Tax=Brassica rapa subsp. trilocularis TaxID=1813537 RepID=A0ABQ7MNK6_BRACM|nr:hypothetical protein IGI04_014930 [Brassica rapa subsp. trilocularis]
MMLIMSNDIFYIKREKLRERIPGRRQGSFSHRRSGLVFQVRFKCGLLFGGAPLYGGRPILSPEVMAFSTSSSPVSVSGRRWLLQHRDRRLLFPGGGGSLSTASAGWFLELPHLDLRTLASLVTLPLVLNLVPHA